jgi:hypothetical protein
VDPIRVKLYGLVSVTRRGYIIQLLFAGLMLVVLLSVWFIRWLAIREEMRGLELRSLDWVITLLDLTPWVVLGVAVLLSVEAWFVFRAFARKRAEQLPAQPPGPGPS